MDFWEIYNELESKYDIGMAYDIKAFFSERDYVSDYNSKFVENTYMIDIKYTGKNEKRIINDFFGFITYDYAGLLHIESDANQSICHIYTTISDGEIGIKIRLGIQKIINSV